jgi:hypothetical protein
VAEDDDIAASVARHGWHAIAVAASEFSPAFVYSIGLCHSARHPDAIVFGLEQDVGYSILAKLASRVRAGEAFAAPGVHVALAADRSVATRPVHDTQHPVLPRLRHGFSIDTSGHQNSCARSSYSGQTNPGYSRSTSGATLMWHTCSRGWSYLNSGRTIDGGEPCRSKSEAAQQGVEADEAKHNGASQLNSSVVQTELPRDTATRVTTC